MRIVLNGEDREVESCRLGAVLRECGYDDDHVATALNGEFVHRHQRDTVCVQEGDKVEVVSPIAGG